MNPNFKVKHSRRTVTSLPEERTALDPGFQVGLDGVGSPTATGAADLKQSRNTLNDDDDDAGGERRGANSDIGSWTRDRSGPLAPYVYGHIAMPDTHPQKLKSLSFERSS